MDKRPVILTGDRPTGRLHLGHYLGSVQNRVALQENADCYFIIADLHTLTTKPGKEDILALRRHTKEIVLDYLAAGIDPQKASIYLQSACPAVGQLNLIFTMLVSLNRVQHLPSIKDMAQNALMEEQSLPFGLYGYPILQAADILMVQATHVPVGSDNVPHIEITRDIARRFNQLYGHFFPLPEPIISDAPSLIGTDGKGKMSKSANNAIYLSDSPEVVSKKVRAMFTDPNRIHANVPGRVENNPVFEYHKYFNSDKEQVQSLQERYRAGTVGDVEVKVALAKALNAFLEPMRVRRAHFESQPGLVESILVEGTNRVRHHSDIVAKKALAQMGLSGFWSALQRKAHRG